MSSKNHKGTTDKQKQLMPLFVHSEIDDLKLPLGAFRVYGHLARRAGSDNFAWPSYSSIGEHCFRSSYPKAKDATLRRKALAAVEELKKAGLIEIEKRTLDGKQGNITNAYRLVSLSDWRKWLEQQKFVEAQRLEEKALPF
jgi:hypothetical protein